MLDMNESCVKLERKPPTTLVFLLKNLLAVLKMVYDRLVKYFGRLFYDY